MFIRLAGERFRVLRQSTGGAWVIAYDEYQMPAMSAGTSWRRRSGLPRRRSMSATGSAPSPMPSSSDTTCSGQPWRMTAASRTRLTAHQYLQP